MATVRKKANKDKGGCSFAEGCPANTLAVDQSRQYNELSGKVEGVLQGLGTLHKTMTNLEITVGQFGIISTQFTEYRKILMDAVEKYSERLRIVELRKAKDEANDEHIKENKNDIDALKNTGMSWIWQALLMLVAAVIGGVLTKVLWKL